MTVRLTQTRSGYPRRSRQPYPTDAGQRSGEADPAPEDGGTPEGSGSPEAVAAEPVPGSRSRVVDRRALRAERRTRRNLAILCGLVVAVCLILTILIVDMARNRPPGAGIAVPVSTPSTPSAQGAAEPSPPVRFFHRPEPWRLGA
jgi:hypothetical protein